MKGLKVDFPSERSSARLGGPQRITSEVGGLVTAKALPIMSMPERQNDMSTGRRLAALQRTTPSSDETLQGAHKISAKRKLKLLEWNRIERMRRKLR